MTVAGIVLRAAVSSAVALALAGIFWKKALVRQPEARRSTMHWLSSGVFMVIAAFLFAIAMCL